MTEQVQFVLPLPHRVSLDRDDYFVSASNEAALAMVESWPAWPQSMLAVVGPAGAGKTHLAGVHIARAAAAGQAVVSGPFCEASNLIIENLDALAGDREAEEAVFHAFNRVALGNGSILFTSRTPLPGLTLALPDLRTRLNTVTVCDLPPPDDALLLAVMLKLFADRQIDAERAASVSMWAVPRMPRSLAAASHFVHELDRRSLAERRKLDTRLAAEVLTMGMDP